MSARLHSGGSPVSHRVTKFPPPLVWAVYTLACSLLRCTRYHRVGVTAALSCLGVEGRETIQAGVCPQERDNKTWHRRFEQSLTCKHMPERCIGGLADLHIPRLVAPPRPPLFREGFHIEAWYWDESVTGGNARMCWWRRSCLCRLMVWDGFVYLLLEVGRLTQKLHGYRLFFFYCFMGERKWCVPTITLGKVKVGQKIIKDKDSDKRV